MYGGVGGVGGGTVVAISCILIKTNTQLHLKVFQAYGIFQMQQIGCR